MELSDLRKGVPLHCVLGHNRPNIHNRAGRLIRGRRGGASELLLLLQLGDFCAQKLVLVLQLAHLLLLLHALKADTHRRAVDNLRLKAAGQIQRVLLVERGLKPLLRLVPLRLTLPHRVFEDLPDLRDGFALQEDGDHIAKLSKVELIRVIFTHHAINIVHCESRGERGGDGLEKNTQLIFGDSSRRGAGLRDGFEEPSVRRLAEVLAHLLCADFAE